MKWQKDGEAISAEALIASVIPVFLDPIRKKHRGSIVVVLVIEQALLVALPFKTLAPR